MIFTAPSTLENYIFKYLGKGPQIIVGLIEKLQKVRPGTTKQGVYAALRVLKEKNLIVVYGGRVSLNSTWLNTMMDYFSVANYHYTEKGNQKNDFLSLQDGERIQYNFKDPITNDKFWGHVQNLLIETAPPGSVELCCNPHYWALLILPTEKGLIDFVLSKKQYFFMLNAGKTLMDKAISQEFNTTTSQYQMIEETLFPKRNYYLSIINDFIIEVWIDKKIAEEIDQVYQLNILSDELKQKLKAITSKKGTTRFVISRNKRKAEKMRKKLMKYFVILKSDAVGGQVGQR